MDSDQKKIILYAAIAAGLYYVFLRKGDAPLEQFTPKNRPSYHPHDHPHEHHVYFAGERVPQPAGTQEAYASPFPA